MTEHIVLLKLKPEVTEEQTTALLEGLVALKDTIPGIAAVQGGYNTSPEGKGNGYTWGFTMQFENAAARDAYLPHPDHKALGANLLRPLVDDVLVFDFERP